MKNHLQKISKYRPSLLQGKLDFTSAGHGFSLYVEHPIEQRLFQGLCILLLVLVGWYLYFVSASVLNIMANREISASIAQVQTAIAALESQYFALDGNVTPATAAELGLIPVRDPQYIYVPGNAASAGIAENKAI